MTESTNKPAKPLWRRILKWTIRIVVVLVVLVLLAHSLWNYIATRRLNAELDRIRQAGEPTTFGELARSREKPPAAEDAGPFYAAALDLVRRDLGERENKFYDDLATLTKQNQRPSMPLYWPQAGLPSRLISRVE